MLRTHLRKSLGLGASKKAPDRTDVSVLIVASDNVRPDAIEFSGILQVDGRVEGDIRCKRLVVTGCGRVDGAVSARSVTVDGMVNGPIEAAYIFLGPTAAIKGNLVYEVLNVATGASLSGMCRDRGRRTVPAREGVAADSPPLAFNLARAACRKTLPILVPRSFRYRNGAGPMKAVWDAYQRSSAALAAEPAPSQSNA